MQIAVVVLIFVGLLPEIIIGVVGAIVMDSAHLPMPIVHALAAVGAMAAVFLLYGVILWFVIRLGFLFTPVVVIERKIDIGRIWNLSKGNA